MGMGEGKVERAEGVLTLEAPEREQQWSRDWICMRF